MMEWHLQQVERTGRKEREEANPSALIDHSSRLGAGLQRNRSASLFLNREETAEKNDEWE